MRFKIPGLESFAAPGSAEGSLALASRLEALETDYGTCASDNLTDTAITELNADLGSWSTEDGFFGDKVPLGARDGSTVEGDGWCDSSIDRVEAADQYGPPHDLSETGLPPAISTLDQVISLDLGGTGLTESVDLTPLAGMEGLVFLNIWNNELGNTTDLEPIGAIPKLFEVIFDNNSFGPGADFSVLGGSTTLTLVSLSDNELGPAPDLSFAADLPELNRFYLSRTGLGPSVDLSPIGVAEKMIFLNIDGNNLDATTDFTWLTSLTNMDALRLNENNFVERPGEEDAPGLCAAVKYLARNHALREFWDRNQASGANDNGLCQWGGDYGNLNPGFHGTGDS